MTPAELDALELALASDNDTRAREAIVELRAEAALRQIALAATVEVVTELRARAEQAEGRLELATMEVDRLTLLLHTPELHAFTEAVNREAAHQRERWGVDHDVGKAPSDWFWLIGYLAGKALAAHIAGNTDKALHHTISTSAACANWHAAILGLTNMQPGHAPSAELAALAKPAIEEPHA